MEKIFMLYLNNSFRMSFIIILLLLLTPILSKKYSASGRYYSFLIVVIGLSIPFRPRFNMPLIKIKAEGIINESNATNLDIQLIIKTMSILWIAGIIVFLLYNIINHLKFINMINRWSIKIDDNNIISKLNCVAREIGIKKDIDIRTCDFIDSPMITGLKRVSIIIPNIEYTDIEIELIIKHELIHLKRGDVVYNIVLCIANSIHWFNPIVYIMAKTILIECEISCDEKVLENSNEEIRKIYGKIIFNVIKGNKILKTPLATSFYGGNKGIKKRLYSIMNIGENKRLIGIQAVIVVLTMLSGAGVFYGTTNIEKIQSKYVEKDNLLEKKKVESNDIINYLTEADIEFKEEGGIFNFKYEDNIIALSKPKGD